MTPALRHLQMEKGKTGFDITYFRNGSQWQRESRASAEPIFFASRPVQAISGPPNLASYVIIIRIGHLRWF